VAIQINGQTVSTLTAPPYVLSYSVPVTATSLTIGAQASDFAGNVATTQLVTVSVKPDTAPAVSIASPTNGTGVVAGWTVPIFVNATDAVSVTQVRILINGQFATTLTSAPYEFDYPVPIGVTSLTIGAQAVNPSGLTGTAQPVTVTVQQPTPPSVSVVAPANGSTAAQGSYLTIQVAASGDVPINEVDILINGQTVVQLTGTTTYTYSYRIPMDVTTLVVGAQAIDALGLTGTAPAATVTVQPDARTTAKGNITFMGNPVAGATVVCENGSATTGADGTFNIPNLHTIEGPLVCSASTLIGGAVQSGSSAAVAPVAGGVTNMGAIALSAVSSFGTDFWLAYPEAGCQSSMLSVSTEISIVSAVTANYTVSFPPTNFNATGVVTPGSPVRVALRNTAGSCAPATVENAGIHVTSDAPISVSLSYDGTPSETYLAIPTASLGTEYYALSYREGNQACPMVARGPEIAGASGATTKRTSQVNTSTGADMLVVVASQNATHVNISDACGMPVAATLNQGQTFNVQCADVTTAHVVSDKPVAVIAGRRYRRESKRYTDSAGQLWPGRDGFGDDAPGRRPLGH
jgi:hypothetical protein